MHVLDHKAESHKIDGREVEKQKGTKERGRRGVPTLQLCGIFLGSRFPCYFKTITYFCYYKCSLFCKSR